MVYSFVLIGVSTGGPAALETVFKGFPDKFPYTVLVVQHMPERFTKLLAERLDSLSKLNVVEAIDNEVPQPGTAYIAPGGFHLVLKRTITGYMLRTLKTERVSGHRPSVDVLFESAAEAVGKNLIAVIMTGMGTDGSIGIKRVHDAGGRTIAQDESTSVVYGMNRAAIEANAIDAIVPLGGITKKILEYIKQ